MRTHPLTEQWLYIAILVFLWGALIEDVLIFLLSWVEPGWWFQLLHKSSATEAETVWLRRSAGQWAAFALVQGLALWRWRREPVWLVLVAGARVSDLFTDLSYLASASSLTTFGWVVLPLLPILNGLGVILLMRAFRQARAALAGGGSG